MSIVQKLTEGIVNRDMKQEGQALLSKWSQTGLLEGLGDERSKQNMARLLENQAKELLREASSMGAGGDVEGFAAVASLSFVEYSPDLSLMSLLAFSL